MKILIVEDDIDFAKAVRDEIAKIGIETLTHVTSMLAAKENITNDFFDLIILDLKIPTEDGVLNSDSAHGIATFTHAKSYAPGTPVIVLTGSSADEHIEVILRYAEQVDVWGEGQHIKMVDFVPKHKLGLLPERLQTFAKAVRQILDIEIKRNNCELSIEQSRLIRIFAKVHNASRCDVSMLSGGLSGAAVFRLTTSDRHGNVIHSAVCKIGKIQDIVDESSRYDQHISRLDPTATPRKLNEFLCGAKATAGVFYSLAQRYPLTGFDITQKDAEYIEKSINSLSRLFSPWQTSESRMRIEDIRRRVLTDANFEDCRRIFDFTWLDAFEQQEIQTRWCCTHGDLHGLNVLISDDGSPILIDYGDVEKGPVSLDPITFEFSLHFHPKGPLRNSAWPTHEQAKQWYNLEFYLADCPVPDFIRACRNWTYKSAPGEREIAVAAYSYLTRQLKYPDPDIPLISAFIEGAKNMYDNTFK